MIEKGQERGFDGAHNISCIFLAGGYMGFVL